MLFNELQDYFSYYYYEGRQYANIYPLVALKTGVLFPTSYGHPYLPFTEKDLAINRIKIRCWENLVNEISGEPLTLGYLLIVGKIGALWKS